MTEARQFLSVSYLTFKCIWDISVPRTGIAKCVFWRLALDNGSRRNGGTSSLFIERHQVASIVRFRVRKDVSQSVWRKFYNDLILKIRSQNVLFLWRLVIIHRNGINCSFHKEDHSSSYYIRNTTSNSLRVVQKIRVRKLDLKSAELRFESVGEREEEREKKKKHGIFEHGKRRENPGWNRI